MSDMAGVGTTGEAASAARSTVVVRRPAEGVVEVVLGRGRSWWELVVDLGKGVLVGATCGGIAAYFTGVAGHVVSSGLTRDQVGVTGVVVFGLVAVACARVIVREYFGQTTFRVTGERLEVSVAGLFGRGVRRGWRRADLFEVRPSHGALQVRLRRDRPYTVLAFRREEELRAAATAVSAALAEVPATVVVEGADPAGGLAYEVPGRRYEIEIERTVDGVRVTVPGEGDRALLGFAPWLTVICISLTLCVGWFVGPWALDQLGRRRAPQLLGFAVVGLPTVTVLGAAAVVLKRWRGGQPLVIVVDGREVRIDHPGVLIRQRRWRRERVTDVRVDASRARGGQVIGYFVRMRARGRWSVTFCHGRDGIEMRRVVTVLRNALGMAPLPDSAFPEDGSAV